MPNVTVMALDCFPRNKGMASSMQGFIQMVFNGLVAGAFVPLVAAAIFNYAVGMALLMGAALLMWWLAIHMGRRLA
jgi:DHA1 family bicyclomycin/chloramphenicol resistance-like MFS transporter